MRVITILIMLLSTVPVSGLSLHRYINSSLPHNTDYVVFSDVTTPAAFFYLPLRLEVASDDGGNQRFGVQFSASPTNDSAIATATLTTTLALHRGQLELDEISAFLAGVFGKPITLSPLAAISYKLSLLLGKGTKEIEIEGGQATIDSTLALSADLSELATKKRLFDFLGPNGDLGGLRLKVTVHEGAPPLLITFSPSTFVSTFQTIGLWSAAKPIEDLAVQLTASSMCKDRLCIDALTYWIYDLLDAPIFVRGGAGPASLSFDLKSPHVIEALRNAADVSIVVSPGIQHDEAYYLPLTLEGSCQTRASRIINLDNGAKGCK